jgi:hypothetical protein
MFSPRPASFSALAHHPHNTQRALWLPLPTPSPLLPKPNSCHHTALGAKRAHTPCFGRHPGFKFIHEWRNSSAHRTDTAKPKTQSKSQWGGWGLVLGGLHPVPRSMTSCIPPICLLFDFISCSMRSLVMPHNATIIASGDEISTTISWNSGVQKSHSCMRRYTL